MGGGEREREREGGRESDREGLWRGDFLQWRKVRRSRRYETRRDSANHSRSRKVKRERTRWKGGESAGEGGEGAEEGTGEADDRGSEWVSSDYRRQFETEWDASSLDRRMEGLQMATSHQRFGKLRALAEVSHVPADGAPFPPPKLSRAPDESWMGECGVLPPLRSALLKSDAGAKRSCGSMIGPAGRTMLHMLSSYRDLYFPSAALREYDDAPHGGGLMRALALHALQHGLTVTRQR